MTAACGQPGRGLGSHIGMFTATDCVSGSLLDWPSMLSAVHPCMQLSLQDQFGMHRCRCCSAVDFVCSKGTAALSPSQSAGLLFSISQSHCITARYALTCDQLVLYSTRLTHAQHEQLQSAVVLVTSQHQQPAAWSEHCCSSTHAHCQQHVSDVSRVHDMLNNRLLHSLRAIAASQSLHICVYFRITCG